MSTLPIGIEQSTQAVLGCLGDSPLGFAIGELGKTVPKEGAQPVDLVSLQNRVDAVKEIVASEPFQAKVHLNADLLQSFIICFSTVRKRTLQRAADRQNQAAETGSTVSRHELESLLECKPLSEWSLAWTEEGRLSLAECSDEEKTLKAPHFAAFGSDCLAEFASFCQYKEAQGDYVALRKWSYFGVDALAQYIQEAKQGDFKHKVAWGYIDATLLTLPSPRDLVSLKDSDDPTESMVEQARAMDAVESHFAATCLVEIHEHLEAQLQKGQKTVGKFSTRPAIFSDPEHVTARLRFIMSSLWLIFRYYLPRHLTYSISRLSIPRHAQWTELIDIILSDASLSFVDIVVPEAATYFCVLNLILRRRVDGLDFISQHVLSSTKTPTILTDILTSLQAYELDKTEALLKTFARDASVDFFLGDIANEITDQIRLAAVDAYYKIHRAISADNMTSIDMQRLAPSRMGPSQDHLDFTTSGETQQLVVRSSYLLNFLEKEVERTKQGYGLC